MFRGIVNRFLLILTVIVAVFFAAIFWDEYNEEANESPVISFEEEILTISVEDEESILLEGVTALDAEDGDVTGSLVIESISDFQDDGSRIVTYAAFDAGGAVSKASRLFYYSDYESPQILLLTDLNVLVGESINIQECIQVVDVLDGNITSRLQVIESDYSMYYAGDYSITLQVSNSAGDTEEVTYMIHSTESSEEVSQTGIVLTDYSIYLEVGDAFDASDYIESVTGFDSSGTEIDENSVKITDTVDTEEAGQYTVTYSVSAYSGSDTAELVVIVR